jgi:pyruvate dehydrogenase E1 component beta subunit
VSTKILMPAMSPSMKTGSLTKWLVKVGDTVNSGDIIAEIETDKAGMEVESMYDGVLSQILVSEGTEDVEIKTPIAIIELDSETVSEPIAVLDTEELKGKLFTNKVKPVKKVAANKKVIKKSLPDDNQFSVREALRDAMAEEMRLDKDVFVIGEEVAEYQGAYKVTQGLLDEFGKDRVIDTPITENGFAGISIGASFAGLKPIVEFMTFNFALQAMDHIINSAAKTLYMGGGQINSQIVFRGPNGAAARVGAQHSQDFSAWFSHIPGLIVIAPYTANDSKGLLKAAIRNPNPVIFLENEILYNDKGVVDITDQDIIEIGKANIVKTGDDITIISFSICMKLAIEASEILSNEGIDVEIIDLRTLKPLDKDTIINSVKKTNKCIVVEQGWSQSGVASEISAILMEEAFDYLDGPVCRVSGKDVPMPYAENLEKLALPTVEDILNAVKKII